MRPGRGEDPAARGEVEEGNGRWVKVDVEAVLKRAPAGGEVSTGCSPSCQLVRQMAKEQLTLTRAKMASLCTSWSPV